MGYIWDIVGIYIYIVVYYNYNSWDIEKIGMTMESQYMLGCHGTIYVMYISEIYQHQPMGYLQIGWLI